MPKHRIIEITNQQVCDLLVDLEPCPLTYVLEPNGVVDVVTLNLSATVSLKFGTSKEGQPYVSIWPEAEELIIERDGKDVFEEWN